VGHGVGGKGPVQQVQDPKFKLQYGGDRGMTSFHKTLRKLSVMVFQIFSHLLFVLIVL
jgi:hypothetical protein